MTSIIASFPDHENKDHEEHKILICGLLNSIALLNSKHEGPNERINRFYRTLKDTFNVQNEYSLEPLINPIGFNILYHGQILITIKEINHD